MIELTLAQAEALRRDSGPATVFDPTTQTAYALVPVEGHANGSTKPMWGSVETPVEPWTHLVRRNHPWRRQLYIKGRNMTVRQLLSTVIPSGFTDEEAADDLDLPVEAIREALAYAEQNDALLTFETAYENLGLAEKGSGLALGLYLDDCADSRLLATLLTQAGHTVVRPVDVGTVGVADPVHLAYTASQGLILVTKNPGDFKALHQQDSNHPGIFAIYQKNNKKRDMKPADIVTAIGRIESALSHGYSITGQFHSLNDWHRKA